MLENIVERAEGTVVEFPLEAFYTPCWGRKSAFFLYHNDFCPVTLEKEGERRTVVVRTEVLREAERVAQIFPHTNPASAEEFRSDLYSKLATQYWRYEERKIPGGVEYDLKVAFPPVLAMYDHGMRTAEHLLHVCETA